MTYYYRKKWTKKEIKPESFIDITLQPEEASVFRKEYEKKILKREHDLKSCPHPSMVEEIVNKLNTIKEELRIFNLYN